MTGNCIFDRACVSLSERESERLREAEKNNIKNANMKSAKRQCNRLIAEARKSYWSELCKNEV